MTTTSHRNLNRHTEAASPNESRYFRDIANHPLLTETEERETAREIQSSLAALRNHLYRSFHAVNALVCSAEDDTNHSRHSGSPGNTREATTAHIQQVREIASELTTRIQDQASEASARALRARLDAAMEAFPLKTHVYLAALDALRQSKALDPWMSAPQQAEHRQQATQLERRFLAARERMVLANLRLVLKVTNQFRNRGIAEMDLIQEGNTTLAKAAERFDPELGTKFSTFAVKFIERDLQRAVDNKSRLIRVPVHRCAELRRFQFQSEQLECEDSLKRDPDFLAAALGMTPSLVRELLELQQWPRSLDEPLGTDNDTPLQECLRDETAWSPAPADSGERLREKLACYLRPLKENDRRVLELRYGLYSGEWGSVEEVAGRMGLSEDRVKRLERRALETVRAQLAALPKAA